MRVAPVDIPSIRASLDDLCARLPTLSIQTQTATAVPVTALHGSGAQAILVHKAKRTRRVTDRLPIRRIFPFMQLQSCARSCSILQPVKGLHQG